MHAEVLLTWVRAVPFLPFRIRPNSGRVFEIRHPEMLRVGRTAAHVDSFAGEPGDPYEKMELISLVLIEPGRAAKPTHGARAVTWANRKKFNPSALAA